MPSMKQADYMVSYPGEAFGSMLCCRFTNTAEVRQLINALLKIGVEKADIHVDRAMPILWTAEATGGYTITLSG